MHDGTLTHVRHREIHAEASLRRFPPGTINRTCREVGRGHLVAERRQSKRLRADPAGHIQDLVRLPTQQLAKQAVQRRRLPLDRRGPILAR